MSASSMKIIVALVAVVLVGAGAGILLLNESDEWDGPVDAIGNPVDFTVAIENIVSTAPSITETLMALGYTDSIIAVSNNCDQTEINDLVDDGEIVRVGSYNKPSGEMIMEIDNAGVVLMGLYSTDTSGTYQILRDGGMKVIMLHGGESRTEIYKNLDLLGLIFEDEDNANDIKQDMIDVFTEVETRGKTASKPFRAMINLGYAWGMDSVYGAGQNTFGHDMLVLANNVNTLDDVSGWKAISDEKIVNEESAPEVIIVLVQGGEPYDQTKYDAQMDALKGNEKWKLTPAVVNDRVHFLYDTAGSAGQRTSPNLADYSKLILMLTHPELFEGVDMPEFIGSEYKDFLEANW